jgi:hypothetical protein
MDVSSELSLQAIMTKDVPLDWRAQRELFRRSRAILRCSPGLSFPDRCVLDPLIDAEMFPVIPPGNLAGALPKTL